MTDRSVTTPADLDGLTFDERGLLPVVAQDVDGGRVLMVAWANRVALERSLETHELHFWSRSRGTLWRKGETSGNVLRVRWERQLEKERSRRSGPSGGQMTDDD